MATTTQQTIPATLTRPKQTAEYFQVSHMTLDRWRKKDGFPKRYKRGQVVLYDIAAITQWLAGGEV